MIIPRRHFNFIKRMLTTLLYHKLYLIQYFFGYKKTRLVKSRVLLNYSSQIPRYITAYIPFSLINLLNPIAHHTCKQY